MLRLTLNSMNKDDAPRTPLQANENAALPHHIYAVLAALAMDNRGL